MTTELDILQRDMHDYADKIADRVSKNRGLEFSRDLIYYQIKDYLDRKSNQNVVRSYAIHWFNNYTIVISVNMTQTVHGARLGSSFSVSFSHLKKEQLNLAIENYNRAMRGI